MAGRERTTTIGCAEKGCRETKFHLYTSQRQYKEIWDWQNEHPWKCTRHADPDKVLRPDNLTTTHVLVASKVRYSGDRYLDGLFWLPEGAERGGSGFTHGPGFNAHASDFPEGTRLIVTTRIEMPEESPDAA